MKALFWNVAGTRNLRKEDWNFIRSHEIIGLAETWEEEGRDISRKELKEYDIKQKFAKKDKKKGRARGGLLLTVKKASGLDDRWEEVESDEAIAKNGRKREKNGCGELRT